MVKPPRCRRSGGSCRWSSSSAIASSTRLAWDEVIGQPSTTAVGKNAHVRVKRVDQSEVNDPDLGRSRAARGESKARWHKPEDCLGEGRTDSAATRPYPTAYPIQPLHDWPRV